VLILVLSTLLSAVPEAPSYGVECPTPADVLAELAAIGVGASAGAGVDPASRFLLEHAEGRLVVHLLDAGGQRAREESLPVGEDCRLLAAAVAVSVARWLRADAPPSAAPSRVPTVWLEPTPAPTPPRLAAPPPPPFAPGAASLRADLVAEADHLDGVATAELIGGSALLAAGGLTLLAGLARRIAEDFGSRTALDCFLGNTCSELRVSLDHGTSSALLVAGGLGAALAVPIVILGISTKDDADSLRDRSYQATAHYVPTAGGGVGALAFAF
jgi:hypothetical protein